MSYYLKFDGNCVEKSEKSSISSIMLKSNGEIKNAIKYKNVFFYLSLKYGIDVTDII
jgi:hypothetical protein